MRRGRGPRGWIRSDERILEEFCDRVIRGGVDASGVEVRCVRGALFLDGRVATAAERTFLSELATDVLGVTSVESSITADEEEGEDEAGPDPLTRH